MAVSRALALVGNTSNIHPSINVGNCIACLLAKGAEQIAELDLAIDDEVGEVVIGPHTDVESSELPVLFPAIAWVPRME